MNTAHTIRFVTTINRDQALLKSILATFGHQRNADWRYQSTGAGECYYSRFG
jgi:ABC-type tungstate transport system permease subunit